MATILDLGNGRYIAGDPADELRPGEHWCYLCFGTGLIEEYDGETFTTMVCWNCSGYGALACDDDRCREHDPVASHIRRRFETLS